MDIIRNLREKPTAADVIEFAVKNNFSAIQKNLHALGYSSNGYNSNSIVTASDAIFLLNNLQNNGYAIAELINVPYIPTVNNETGRANLQGGFTAAKIDWDKLLNVGTTILGVISTVIGGAAAVNAVNNKDNSEPPPAPNPQPVSEVNPALFYATITVGVVSLLLLIYSVITKNKTGIVMGVLLLVLSGGGFLFANRNK
jgi:hypothetical protein